MFKPTTVTVTLMVICSGLASTQAAPPAAEGISSLSEKIDYIKKDIPKISLPSYSGKRYKALVPDTLDLQNMAELTIDCITGITDPKKDYEIYWLLSYRGDRPVMSRDLNHQVQLGMQRGLPFNRLISGTRHNMNVEQRWLEVLFHLEGPDGLLYYPLKGRPWIDYKGSSSGQYDDFEGDQYTGPLNNGSSLEVLAAYYALTHDERIKQLGIKVINGMNHQCVHRKDSDDGTMYAFFAKGIYGLEKVDDPDSPLPDYTKAAALGWTCLNLNRFYEATHYEPALDLAGQFARYVRKHSGLFDPDARWTGNPHFPWHCGCLLGLADYAITAKDGDLLNFVRKSFEYAKAPAQGGNLLMGWFPENAAVSGQTGENCAVSLMINIACKLTKAGAGDYWDDVDRWTRNHFAECQMRTADWLFIVSPDKPPYSVNPVFESDDKELIKRNVGGYAGWPSPNDFLGRGLKAVFMHCCIAEACMTVYRVWDNIITYEPGVLRVNLLLNRASPWADIDSYVPYQGRVDVKLKTDCELSIRIPEWVHPDDVQAFVNNEVCSVTFNGRYARIGKVKNKDIARLTFPIFERTDTVTIQEKEYTLIRKGNDVVYIYPVGVYHPLYQQREKYRDATPLMKEVERFVSDRQIDW